MLDISFIGKKFSCNAQFEIADEIDGEGLKLNLRVREICKKYLKPHGPVLATLHVNVTNCRPNDVTKCKELLAFLKEQVLPKTMKLVSLKRLKKIKDEEKSEGANWLRCIWPGKTRKRKEETKNKPLKNTRGYSSDTENYTQKCRGRSNLSESEAPSQASKAGILATPMLSRPQCMRKTNGDKKNVYNENAAMNCSLKRISPEKQKTKDGDIALKSGTIILNKAVDKNENSGKGAEKDLEKRKHDKVGCRNEGPQYVQTEQPDWYSSSDISASDSFVGFYLFNKSTEETAQSSTIDEESSLRRNDGDVTFVKSNELGLQRRSDSLRVQEAIENNKDRIVDLCGAPHNLESFAAVYVRKMCEVTLSRHTKEKSKEVAREIVANVVRLARCKLIQQEESTSRSENCSYEEKGNVHMDYIENPSFSKVWKYSRVFSAEFCESLKNKDSMTRDEGVDTYSNNKEVGNVDDCQFEELLERRMIDSLETSNDDPTSTSFNSSNQSINIDTLGVNASESSTLKTNQECFVFDREFIRDYTLEEAAKNIQTTNEVICETKNEMVNGHCDMTQKEIAFQDEKEEKKWKESRKNENSSSNLGKPPPCNTEDRESKNTNRMQKNATGFSNETNAEDCTSTTTDYTPKTDENTHVSDLFNGDKPFNTGGGKPGEKKFEKSLSSLARNNQTNDKSDNNLNIDSLFTRRRALYKRTMSESQASERKQWSPLESTDSSFYTSFHSSVPPCTAAPKYVRSSSCPVVSEDDVMFESMQSHHRDVHDSLSKRTWIILHVHELWNGGKPIDAIKACIDLTGMEDVEEDTPYTQVPRDYALFLNILQQLPSSCSMWSLDLFVLVLPKLKGFISSQHHTSHVEMACNIIHVVLKKVAVVIRRTSKATKNKDKEQKVKVCTHVLKEIKDMASDVTQTVKSGNRSNTEDPGSMKLVLKELQLALGTFFEQI